MNVRVEVAFESPSNDDKKAMRSLGRRLTDTPASVRVFAEDARPGWLIVEFTMPTSSQYLVVPKIDWAIHVDVVHYVDFIIGFPKSAVDLAYAARKAARLRAKRKRERPK